MAEVGSVNVRINADTANLNSGIQNAQVSLDKFGASMTNLGTKLTIGLTTPLALAAKLGLEFDSNMQQAKASFGTLLADQPKADKLVNSLRQMADTTPFETTDLTKASQTLLGFGLNQFIIFTLPHVLF
jgi:hypothetical protein